MPGMDGLELLSEVRRQYPMTPVIVLTAYVSLDNAMAAWRRGALTCVFKPLQDLAVLEEAVDKCVAHIQHWSDILIQLRGMSPGNAA
jgi:DNA-binding NtrC family response regulator